MKHLLLTVACCCLAFSFTACGEDSTTEQDKGPEELQLSPEGKADSFFSPTEFGELVFEEDVDAEFEDDKIFHSWTFTLSGGSDFFIETDPDSKKTDTVMYLYRRTPGASGWGRYIQKNDDRDESNAARSELSSRIGWTHKDTDEEVEYRVIVKPYRKDTRASYTLRSGCTGYGCSSSDVDPALTCEGTGGVTGGSYEFTQSCANALDALVRSAPVNPTQSLASCLEDRGTELYKQTDLYTYYVDDYGEAEALSYLDTDLLNTYELGALVDVDMGGDEDTYIFIFDQNGDLFMSRWENQSSINEWSCGDSSEPALDDLDDTCMSLINYNMGEYSAHAKNVIAEGSGVVGSSIDNELAEIALNHAIEEFGTKSGSPYTYSHNGKLDLQSLMTLETLDSDGNTLRVDIIQELNWDKTKYWRYLYTTKVKGDVAFVCEELESVDVK